MVVDLAAEQEADGAAAGDALLDAHRDFLLSVDDASRRGYALTGVGAVVVAALVVLATGTRLWSLRTLWLAPLSAFVALVVGRRTGLARQDRRLRERIRYYCERRGVSPSALVDAARQSGRYEFFTKLCWPLALEAQRAQSKTEQAG